MSAVVQMRESMMDYPSGFMTMGYDLSGTVNTTNLSPYSILGGYYIGNGVETSFSVTAAPNGSPTGYDFSANAQSKVNWSILSAGYTDISPTKRNVVYTTPFSAGFFDLYLIVDTSGDMFLPPHTIDYYLKEQPVGNPAKNPVADPVKASFQVTENNYSLFTPGGGISLGTIFFDNVNNGDQYDVWGEDKFTMNLADQFSVP
jgi:hypothetical protein